jgi:hypothetical protein
MTIKNASLGPATDAGARASLADPGGAWSRKPVQRPVPTRRTLLRRRTPPM